MFIDVLREKARTDAIKSVCVIGTSANYHINAAIDAIGACLCASEISITILAKEGEKVQLNSVLKGLQLSDIPWGGMYESTSQNKHKLSAFTDKVDCVILLLNNRYELGYHDIIRDINEIYSGCFLKYDIDGGTGNIGEHEKKEEKTLEHGSKFNFLIPAPKTSSIESSFQHAKDIMVEWRGDGDANSGYGVVSRNIVKHLNNQGVGVREIGLNDTSLGDKIQIIHTPPPGFVKNNGKYKIGFVVAEVNGLPQTWVDCIDKVDEIWTHTNYCAGIAKKYLPEKKISVFNMGIKKEVYHPRYDQNTSGDRFIFLSNFVWGRRKGFDVLLEAYLKEFSCADNVGLVIKTSSGPYSIKEINTYINDICKKNKAAAAIKVLIDFDFSDSQMSLFYNCGDCFVLPTRGEGLGLTCLEAMACGLPVICTQGTACEEYMYPNISYPIDCKSELADGIEYPHYRGFEWLKPDCSHLRKLMRHVYENREEGRQKGMLASEYVYKTFEWESASLAMAERLKEIESEIKNCKQLTVNS